MIEYSGFTSNTVDPVLANCHFLLSAGVEQGDYSKEITQLGLVWVVIQKLEEAIGIAFDGEED